MPGGRLGGGNAGVGGVAIHLTEFLTHWVLGGHRFKAKLWLCEEHPLSLCEQVAPIIDLMAVSNALFAKLRDFITLRLPPGFPVKIGENPSPMRLDGDWGLGRSGFR